MCKIKDTSIDNHPFDDTSYDEFWEQKIAIKNDRDVARIDGSHYIIGSRTKPSDSNGLGGQWRTIKFNDGRIVKTCDLWHQGKIPDSYKDRLPDNAIFYE
jgi:hypothetical protein